MKRLFVLLLIGCGQGVPPRGLAVRIAAPHTALEARSAGCWLEDDLSPALGRLAAEAGGFESYLSPRGAPMRWVIVFEAPWIWGSARQQFSLFLRRGEQVGVEQFSVVEEEPHGFHDVWLEEDGWISGVADRIELPPLEVEGAEVPIVLESVTFDARVLADDRGITIHGGALAGRMQGESTCLSIDVEPARIEGPKVR